MNALMDALDGIGYALDTPGAYLRGALSGRFGERASGQEMLSSLGMEDPVAGAGFAAELVSDPLAIAMPLLGALGIKRMFQPGLRNASSPQKIPPMAEGPFTLIGASPGREALERSGLSPLQREVAAAGEKRARWSLFDPVEDDLYRQEAGGLQFRGPDGKAVEVGEIFPRSANRSLRRAAKGMYQDLTPAIDAPIAGDLFSGVTHAGDETILRQMMERVPSSGRVFRQLGIEDGVGRYGAVQVKKGLAVNTYEPVEDGGSLVWRLAGSRPAEPGEISSMAGAPPIMNLGSPPPLTEDQMYWLRRINDRYAAPPKAGVADRVVFTKEIDPDTGLPYEFIATLDGKEVGAATLGDNVTKVAKRMFPEQMPGDDKAYRISSILVDPEHQRQGIGSKLYEYIYSRFPKGTRFYDSTVSGEAARTLQSMASPKGDRGSLIDLVQKPGEVGYGMGAAPPHIARLLDDAWEKAQQNPNFRSIMPLLVALGLGTQEPA